jgi:hypothetical protein
MDAIGLATLESEMRQDARVMAEALRCALDRIKQPHPAGLEASAHHLHRFYNAFEQMGLRLAKAFENHIDGDAGWHSSVLNRLALEIPGVRPAEGGPGSCARQLPPPPPSCSSSPSWLTQPHSAHDGFPFTTKRRSDTKETGQQSGDRRDSPRWNAPPRRCR